MYRLNLQQIAKILKAKTSGSALDQISINSVSTDSRTLKAGDLFIAIVGDNFNGHDFVQQVVDAGANAVIVSQKVPVNIPQIIVTNTHQALCQLAQYQRQLFSGKLLAITGSYGKTTVKEMLAAILRNCGKTLATYANLNNTFGVPLTLLKLNENHDYLVLELGINLLNEMPTLLATVKPVDIALVTGIAEAHAEGLGDIQSIADQKSLVYRNLSQNGCAIVNLDCAFSDKWCKQLTSDKSVITFGLNKSANVTATHIKLNKEGQTNFILHTPAGEIAVKNNLVGQHQVINALAAAASALAAGAHLSAIKQGLAQVESIAGRLQIKSGIAGCRIIDDTYNASNFSAVKAALDVLKSYSGKHIFVFAGIAELGDKTVSCHRKIGALVKEMQIDHLYTCDEYGHMVAEAYGNKAKHFTDHASLLQTLKADLTADAVVLVKGSRRYQLEKTILPQLLQIEKESTLCS